MSAPLAPIDLAREADFALGGAQVRPALRLFAANGADETVEPRVMQVLVALARRRGEVVGRDELVTLCWEGRVVGEDAIQRAVAKVRKLGETSGAFALETIPKVGYRLKASGAEVRDTAAQPANERHNLPRRQETLIGRESDLANIAALLRESDLVTITGPGGVGKTRLALEAGRQQIDRYADGVWLIELAPVSDSDLAPSAIARALGVSLLAKSEPISELLDRLRGMRALLVLDNCEHLIDAAATLAERILQQAPGVKLLATSQEPLGVEGERVFRLRSLSETDAAQLFVARAKAADSGFTVTAQNAETIRTICARLDGIPLAIEMAAARAPALGCDNLLERLDDRFRLLTAGRRTALPRQRTLQATLDWSHSLLSETEAAVFRRLGAFSASALCLTLEGSIAIARDERIDDAAVIDALASLAAKSLVVIDYEDGRPLYRLLETMRAYAQEKLAQAGEINAVRRTYIEYNTSFRYRDLREVSHAHFSEFAGAVLRAAHTLDDATPKVFTDALALPLTGVAPDEAAVFAARTRTLLHDQLTPLWLLRARYAEERLGALRERIGQYVMLGAGLASAGLRHASEQLKVFEIDEAPLQHWKRARLAELGVSIPAQLRFAPCDLEACAPADALAEAGYDSAAPAFIWLNGTYHLSLDAIERTLRWAATQPRGSELALGFVVPCGATDEISAAPEPRGMRWRTFFTPEQMTDLLRSVGFRHVEHFTPDDANARYFAGRTDGLRAPFLERLVSASIT